MKQTDYIEKSYIDSYTIKCYVVRKLKLSTVRLMPIHYLYPNINGSCVILLNCERGKLDRRTQGQKVVQTAVFPGDSRMVWGGSNSLVLGRGALVWGRLFPLV